MKSKLETYEDILEILLCGPLSSEDLSLKADVDFPSVVKHIDFLIKNELVEQRRSGKKMMCAVTERGVAVLRALSFQKYLGKIKDKVRAIDEAMQALPSISEQAQQLTRKRNIH